MGAIPTFSVKEKNLNPIQHAKPPTLLLSPQRMLARSAVAAAFHFIALYAPRIQ